LISAPQSDQRQPARKPAGVYYRIYRVDPGLHNIIRPIADGLCTLNG